MRFSQVLASSAAFVCSASALANETVHFTTVVSTAFTTFCPSATVIPVGNITYTITEPTTLTITNCPCTVTTHSVVPPPHSVVPPPHSVVPPPHSVVPPPHSVVPPPHSVVPPPLPPPTIRPTAPSHTPITPTTTGPPIVPTAAADKTKAGLGALIIAGVAALAL